jgi:hypothetical protein
MNKALTLHRIADNLPDFVACVATHIWHPRQRPTDYFIMYVRKVISATNLDLSTSLLALYYVYSLRQVCSGDTGSETKVLTVGFMLSNKFLQDSPFALSIWSNVSGFTPNQLCIMEREFLQSIQYRLHISSDTFESFLNGMIRVVELCFPKFWRSLGGNMSDIPPVSSVTPSPPQVTAHPQLPLLSFQTLPPLQQLTLQGQPGHSPANILSTRTEHFPPISFPTPPRTTTSFSLPTSHRISPSSHNISHRLNSPRRVAAMTNRIGKPAKTTPPTAQTFIKLSEQRKAPLTPVQLAELVSRSGQTMVTRGRDINFS